MTAKALRTSKAKASAKPGVTPTKRVSAKGETPGKRSSGQVVNLFVAKNNVGESVRARLIQGRLEEVPGRGKTKPSAKLQRVVRTLADFVSGHPELKGYAFTIQAPPARPATVQRPKGAAAAPTVSVEARTILDAARERGLGHMQAVLHGEDMLSLDAAAQIGPSAKTLNTWRTQRRILALKLPAADRGYRYPRWQFEANVQGSIGEILRALPTWSDWKIFGFLTKAEPLLGNTVPLDLLRAGRAADVLRVAQTLGQDYQGAN